MYDERLNTANALDFDDLLIKTVKLLRTSPETREKYNDRFKYILVDEYQDINAAQDAIIAAIGHVQVAGRVECDAPGSRERGGRGTD